MRRGCWRPATTDRRRGRRGFDWGALNDLLAAPLEAPRRFHLEDNPRCPGRVAAIVERASEWYVHLDQPRRPTKQRQQKGGQHVDAHLLHVVADVQTTVGLLERLDGGRGTGRHHGGR